MGVFAERTKQAILGLSNRLDHSWHSKLHEQQVATRNGEVMRAAKLELEVQLMAIPNELLWITIPENESRLRHAKFLWFTIELLPFLAFSMIYAGSDAAKRRVI